MSKRKPYTFTLNEEAMSWFKDYSKKTDRSMSSILNSHILSLKEEHQTRSLGVAETAIREDFRARPYPPDTLIIDLLGR